MRGTTKHIMLTENSLTRDTIDRITDDETF